MRAAFAPDGPPKYERQPAGPAVDAFEDTILEQLESVPTMPATVIAERVEWARGITVFRERVAELRPAYLRVDSASGTSYAAGDHNRATLAGIRRPCLVTDTLVATRLPELRRQCRRVARRIVPLNDDYAGRASAGERPTPSRRCSQVHRLGAEILAPIVRATSEALRTSCLVRSREEGQELCRQKLRLLLGDPVAGVWNNQ